MKFNIPALTEETVFVRNGDVISRIILWLGGALLLMNVITLIKKRLAKARK
jgi:hypothetical protein